MTVGGLSDPRESPDQQDSSNGCGVPLAYICPGSPLYFYWTRFHTPPSTCLEMTMCHTIQIGVYSCDKRKNKINLYFNFVLILTTASFILDVNSFIRSKIRTKNHHSTPKNCVMFYSLFQFWIKKHFNGEGINIFFSVSFKVIDYEQIKITNKDE